MSSRDSHRVKVVIGWTLPKDNELSVIADHSLVNDLRVLQKRVDGHYMAGSVIKTVQRDGDSVVHTFRLRHKGYSRHTRKTSWTQLLLFVAQVKKLSASIPATMNPVFDLDMEQNHMPWVFHTGFNTDGRTNLFLRPEAIRSVVQLNRKIRISNPENVFANLMDHGDRKTYAMSDQFMLFGRERAVEKYERSLRAIEQAGPNKNIIDPYIRASGQYGYPLEDQLLVLYRDSAGQWVNIPGTGFEVTDGEFTREALTSQRDTIFGLNYEPRFVN
ncbi:hypothetical protein ST201phi2-1p420 [Pseudomonas phage 201phi2-1]|uniref:Uncharacterized protein n=1 Tax=Pseudomonas phage 201phi2-1 TaxID=198110 RepID=B3FJS9_BP201|nr:hypothetical protein ST201phi2-1p420 [Pseudomonas phage 201phi2-1]ABY63244.1 hypothetical protein 201phi2-1p420 [Pseudomonas phage 201phi2-1]